MDELIEIPKSKLTEIIRIIKNISRDASKDVMNKMDCHIIKQNAERLLQMCNDIIEIYGGDSE